ncbi:MAG: photosystem II biosynthesis protein [Cyanobium sp.]
MAPDRQRRAAKAKQPRQNTPARSAPAKAKPSRSSQAIPEAVANRMARRITIATGIPTVLGMGVFIASYLLVSRHILDIPPSATLLASGGCFLLGLLGLSYGVLSASWEEEAGSLLGGEQIPVNLGRMKASLRALREGSQTAGKDPS